jgi:hypothetical protein
MPLPRETPSTSTAASSVRDEPDERRPRVTSSSVTLPAAQRRKARHAAWKGASGRYHVRAYVRLA